MIAIASGFKFFGTFQESLHFVNIDLIEGVLLQYITLNLCWFKEKTYPSHRWLTESQFSWPKGFETSMRQAFFFYQNSINLESNCRKILFLSTGFELTNSQSFKNPKKCIDCCILIGGISNIFKEKIKCSIVRQIALDLIIHQNIFVPLEL